MKNSSTLTPPQYQARFSASGTPTPSGAFEITCITAGVGNGWHFTPKVLQASLPLWAHAHCFIDHAWLSRSVRDLAGQIDEPRWDETVQGITAMLTPFGPGGELLTSFGAEVLNAPSPPNVGFSADIVFTAEGKSVKEILKVLSLDLVYDPARGGAFKRAIYQSNYERSDSMSEITPNTLSKPKPTPLGQDDVMPAADGSTEKEALQRLMEDQTAFKQLFNQHQQAQELEKIVEESNKARLQMCAYLLDTSLAGSKLPLPAQEHIRQDFKERIFDPDELQAEITRFRGMLSDLNASTAVSGPGRISAMFNEADKLQAAVDDLLGAPRDANLAAVSVPRLTGVRELYLSLTGDTNLHGGYHPDRAHLATTADFTGLIKNALNKLVVNQWDVLGRAGYDWWKNITVQEHFTSLHDITGTLIGTVGDLPVVSEGDDYKELQIGDSPETASFIKYGGYIPLTLELIDRDETRKLKAYARELGSAGIRKISKLVAEIFTVNAGAGPTLADSGALFNSSAVTSKGGHKNLLTAALADSAWDTVSSAVYNQPMLIKNETGLYGAGPKMAINPKFCLVPRGLMKTAYQIFKGEFVREATYVYDNVLKGSAVPVVVPEWTDVDDWAAACDPAVAPAIYVGERFGLMPEIYVAGSELSPAVFMNDEHRLKVRHFLAVWVNDFRPLHKSNVA